MKFDDWLFNLLLSAQLGDNADAYIRRQAVDYKEQLKVEHGYLTANEYYPARIQYKPTQKAMDAGIIAGVKNRTVLFNREVLTVLEGF